MNSREDEEFTVFLRGAVRQAEELKYFPSRFKKMINADGGFATVKRILESGKPSEGFQNLWKLGRLGLTCEAIIVESKWRPFFDPELLNRAEKLLEQSDYKFSRFLVADEEVELVKQSPSDTDDARKKYWNRKQFLEANGATCSNWTWSWSFVNHAEKVVIFGAWDAYEVGDRALILSEDWAISRRGRRQPGYSQAREHIRLIEEGSYELKTFPMTYSEVDEDGDVGPAKIQDFKAELTSKSLIRIGTSWYASDEELTSSFPEELQDGEGFVEGSAKSVRVNAYERSPGARAKCLAHHGYACVVCDFDFEAAYGSLGKNYIHVHHIVPLSEIRGEYLVDPIKDLVPICPNCHAMIHLTRPCLSIEQLKGHLKSLQPS